jgi:hypothetical protein
MTVVNVRDSLIAWYIAAGITRPARRNLFPMETIALASPCATIYAL